MKWFSKYPPEFYVAHGMALGVLLGVICALADIFMVRG